MRRTDAKAYESVLGDCSFGSSGIGHSSHLAAEMFKQRVGVEAVHMPYKGASPYVADLLGRQFTFTIGTLPGLMPTIQPRNSSCPCSCVVTL